MKGIPTPTAWLGQSVDTSSICSTHNELSRAPFLTSLGCAIRKPSLKRTHFTPDLKAKLGISGPLMVDSGGFALMMNPKSKWSLRDVSTFINKIDADIFVSLDHPPALRDSRAERKRKILSSIRNFQTLSDRFSSKRIMPVVHGRTISEIEFSIDLIGRYSQYSPWIGLGGIVPLLQHRLVSREIDRLSPEVFIGLALSKIRRAFPKARIHAFGAGGTRTFPAAFAFGADSADSIGWRQAAGFGSIFLPLKSQRAVVWNDKRRPPRKLLDESDIDQLGRCECPICASRHTTNARLSALRSSFHNRSIHNAWIVAKQVKHWPQDRQAMLNLLASGAFGSAWAKAASLNI